MCGLDEVDVVVVNGVGDNCNSQLENEAEKERKGAHFLLAYCQCDWIGNVGHEKIHWVVKHLPRVDCPETHDKMYRNERRSMKRTRAESRPYTLSGSGKRPLDTRIDAPIPRAARPYSYSTAVEDISSSSRGSWSPESSEEPPVPRRKIKYKHRNDDVSASYRSSSQFERSSKPSRSSATKSHRSPGKLASRNSSVLFTYERNSKSSFEFTDDDAAATPAGRYYIRVPSATDSMVAEVVRVRSKPSVIPCMDPFAVPSNPVLETMMRSNFSSTTVSKKPSRILSSNDVRQHNTTSRSDWLVLDDKVYDVITFLKENPKLEDKLLKNYHAGLYKAPPKKPPRPKWGREGPVIPEVSLKPSAFDHLAQNCLVNYGPFVYDVAQYIKDQPKLRKKLRKYRVGELSSEDPEFKGSCSSCCRGPSSSSNDTIETWETSEDGSSLDYSSGERSSFKRILGCSII